MQACPSVSDAVHMTTSFYVPPDQIYADRLILHEDEARHATRVLRAAVGDEIIVVDGAAGWYRVEIDHIDRRSVSGHIVERRSNVGEPPYDLVLAFGLIKHRGRFETLLEKAVELGVSELVPLVTERTERERIREERSEGILIAAMKQCGRSRLPRLAEPQPLAEFLTTAAARRPGYLQVICHESATEEDALLPLLTAGNVVRSIVAAVGPEGGFSQGELHSASAAGFKIVSLGSRRLRSETAGIAVATAVMLAHDHGEKPTHRHT